MGMFFGSVTFPGQAPDLARITAAVTERSGLALAVEESGADIKGGLHDMHARLAFACAPREQLELYSYRPGAVKAFSESVLVDVPFPTARFLQGMNELEGAQTVYLRASLGLEPTLLAFTLLALEALGGRLAHPFPEDLRRQYGAPVTVADLEERHRQLGKQARLAAAVVLLLLPVLIPLWCLGFCLFLVMLPWYIGKACQLYRRCTEDRGNSA